MQKIGISFMAVDSIPNMDIAEKPKGRLFNAVLPSVWFIKLRSMRRKSRTLRASGGNEPATPDSAPFLPKAVENCYKHTPGSETRTFSPLQGPQTSASPGAENPVVPENTPSRKSAVRSEATTRATPVTSIAATTSSTSSVFTRCMYRSTFFSGVRSLCKLVGDEGVSAKGSSSSSMQYRKTSIPTMRQWFLVGCGGAPRPRTRHSSLDLEKESRLMEMDGDSGFDCIEEGIGLEPSPPSKSASGSRVNAAPWNVDLNEEVVKNQVVVKKIFPTNRELEGMREMSPIKLKLRSKPTLGHLFSTRSDTDSPRRIFPDTEEESEVHIEDPKLVTLPWKSTSFGSDSTFRVPSLGSENGLVLSERKPYSSFSESDHPGAFNDEFDSGNISDSQSLLREKMLAAERLREGSKSWRDHRKSDVTQKDEGAMKLLTSLDQALDLRNLKKLIEDEENSGSMFDSTRFELHNSPVFESFLESSAKAWGIDFPNLKANDLKISGSVSEKSKELHCVTVQSALQMEKARDQAQERDNRGRKTARAARMNSSSPAKVRKVKRLADKEVSKKPSPSRKPFPKNVQEERTIHPQREESLVDPELRDEFNHAGRKFSEARKRAKQRRSKHVAPAPSPPAAAPKDVAKDRVVVVVESSYCPYNDFCESMIEMIVDQDIQETGDLEELLQCYLSLNEAEYHNVIMDVFNDVWHELFENKS